MHGAWAKIDRAKQHLEQLNAELTQDRQDYGIRCWNDSETGEHVFDYVAPLDTLIVNYGVLAGEVISQARTALEHAVWEMIPNPEPGKTGFPVIWEQAEFQKKASRMIKGINNSAAAIIERLQPFNNGGAASLLYVLDDMWNIDKHRTLHVMVTDIVGLQRTYIEGDRLVGREIGGIPNVTNNRTAILRVPFRECYRPNVNMVFEYGVRLEFRDIQAARGKTVEALLTQLIEFSESTVRLLAETA